MVIAPGGPAATFAAIESVLDALLKSESTSEFCRAIVHSELTGDAVQGCQIMLLDNTSKLSVIAGYGVGLEIPEGGLSAWDDHPVSDSVRGKQFIFRSDFENQSVVAIPLLRDAVPIGCLLLVMLDSVRVIPFSEQLVPILAKLGAYCLSNLPLSSTTKSNREANGEDLTTRQLQILEFMAEGLINSEIANKLLLSESTIRQETVRIFRSLGVPNRVEAARKGRALGLIAKAGLQPPIER